MAIANLARLQNRMETAIRAAMFTGTANDLISLPAGRLGSMWNAATAADGGAVPTVPVVPTAATLGALPIVPAANLRFLGSVIGASMNVIGGGSTMGTGMTVILCDRLSHQGGLSGTAAGAQTTNLPTAPLTRSVGGAGVFAAYEIYTAIGNNAGVTVTCSYTNQAGTAGRTSAPAPIAGGSSLFSSQHVSVIFGLAAGDTGVRSVENVTLSGTTGAPGAFGITLFRPLAVLPLPYTSNCWTTWDGFLSQANLPLIEANACLYLLFRSNSGSVHFLRLHGWFNYD